MPAGESSISRNAAWTFAFRIITVCLAVVSTGLLARVLGPEGQGAYASLVYLWTVAATFAGMGIPQVNTVFAGRPGYQMNALIANSTWFVLWSVLLALVLAVLSSIVPDSVLAGLPRGHVLTVLLLTPLGVAVGAANGLMWGVGRLREWNVVFVTLGPFITLICCAYFAVTSSLYVGTALAAWFAGQVVTLVIGGELLRRYRAEFVSAPTIGVAHALRLFKESLSFGTRANAAYLVGLLNFRLDTFIVLALLGTREVGLYSIAVTLTQLLFLFSNSLSAALVPVFSSAARERVVELTNLGLRATLVVGLISGVALAGVARLILPVLGSAYVEAWPALLTLVPGVAVYSLANVTSAYWQSFARKPQLNLALAGASLCIDVALDLVLIPRFGIVGAAGAATAAYMGSMALSLVLYCHWARVGFGQIFALRWDDLWSVAGKGRSWPALG